MQKRTQSNTQNVMNKEIAWHRLIHFPTILVFNYCFQVWVFLINEKVIVLFIEVVLVVVFDRVVRVVPKAILVSDRVVLRL